MANGSGNVPDGTENHQENLRAEYAAAQESAQHHDNITWTVVSLVWGASLVLMGFILSSLQERSLRPLLTLLCILGIALTSWAWYAREQLNGIKKHKYERCKQIEQLLSMQQHSTLRYTRGRIGLAVGVMSVAFMITWVAVLFVIWCCQCTR